MTTPGGKSPYVTPGGSNAYIWTKKRPKYPYYAISDLKTIPNIKEIAFNTKLDTISSK
jgi:hypothetical protein